MDAFRACFPACAHLAYLNAGTDGPLPRAAAAAGMEALRLQAAGGRFQPHFEARFKQQDALRSAYARVVGCEPAQLALTTSTSEGLARVLAGLFLGPGDEILTSDVEHPGLIGPLIAARMRGARIRTAPLASIAQHVTPQTTLVACSHVGWVSGELADSALAEVDVPVVLDGAQGAGAIGVDVVALRCAAYAAAGQKWLCGADGTGLLYVSDALHERLHPIAPAYLSFASVAHGLDSPLHSDARRHDTASLPREGTATSLAAFEVLEDEGWDAVHARGRALAATFAQRLSESGRTVAPRADTTLVAWEDDDPPATRARLASTGVVIRDLPGTRYLRASVGAWNDESDLELLLAALGR